MSGVLDPSIPRSLYNLLPGVEVDVQLLNKTTQGSPDTFAAAKIIKARRRPSKDDEKLRSNLLTTSVAVTFSILDDGSDPAFVVPLPDGRLVDDTGQGYTIRSVKSTILNTLHSCVCTQEWPTG